MHQALLFLSRFLVGLWIVLVGAFVSLLLSNAPNVPHTAPFASLSINSGDGSIVYLPNRIFTCTETAPQFQCQTEIQGRLLSLNLTKSSNYQYSFSDCRAFYDRQSVTCQEIGQTYAPIVAALYEITGLELNSQQLQAIKQDYWGINALMKLGELRLMWISAGLSFAAGIIFAFFTWLHPSFFSKAFSSLACGFGMYQAAWSVLGRVQYDLITPYGLTPDTWGWVINGAAIALGIGTIFATALLLWQNVNRLTKGLLIILSSIGLFSLCWFFFGLSGVYWPVLFPNGYMLMWISAAISAVFTIAAAIFLWPYTNQSIKKFVCLGSSVGAIALMINLFLALLLGLGYAD
jgi:hypothetical protein